MFANVPSIPKKTAQQIAEDNDFLQSFRLVTSRYQQIIFFVPSFSSKRGHVTEKHAPTGCKQDMFGCQPLKFEGC